MNRKSLFRYPPLPFIFRLYTFIMNLIFIYIVVYIYSVCLRLRFNNYDDTNEHVTHDDE